MKTNYIKNICAATLVLAGAGFTSLNAQTNNAAAKPFLKANLDARNIALAGAASSVSPDAYSLYDNASKAVFSGKTLMVGASYSPWRPTLSKDIKLFSLSGFYKLDRRSALLVGARYFKEPSMKIEYSNNAPSSPYDYSVDFGYAYAPISNLSFSATAGYANSKNGKMEHKDLVLGIGATFRKNFSGYEWTSALSLSNIGVNMDSGKGLSEGKLPTTLVFGNTLSKQFSANQKVALSVDAIQYMLPSKARALEGAFGVEYTVSIVSLRAGYRLANEDKGAYSYATCGLGLKYKGFGLDGAYIFASKNTPMQNAWWLSTSFDF